jgi:hypothetical protein
LIGLGGQGAAGFGSGMSWLAGRDPKVLIAWFISGEQVGGPCAPTKPLRCGGILPVDFAERTNRGIEELLPQILRRPHRSITSTLGFNRALCCLK